MCSTWNSDVRSKVRHAEKNVCHGHRPMSQVRGERSTDVAAMCVATQRNSRHTNYTFFFSLSVFIETHAKCGQSVNWSRPWRQFVNGDTFAIRQRNQQISKYTKKKKYFLWFFVSVHFITKALTAYGCRGHLTAATMTDTCNHQNYLLSYRMPRTTGIDWVITKTLVIVRQNGNQNTEKNVFIGLSSGRNENDIFQRGNNIEWVQCSQYRMSTKCKYFICIGIDKMQFFFDNILEWNEREDEEENKNKKRHFISFPWFSIGQATHTTSVQRHSAYRRWQSKDTRIHSRALTQTYRLAKQWPLKWNMHRHTMQHIVRLLCCAHRHRFITATYGTRKQFTPPRVWSVNISVHETELDDENRENFSLAINCKWENLK